MADQVLDELERIETAADEALAQSENQKKDLLKANEDRMKAFDEETKKSSDRQVAEMRAALEKKYKDSVKKLSADNDRILSALEQNYRAKEDELADEIVKQILT